MRTLAAKKTERKEDREYSLSILHEKMDVIYKKLAHLPLKQEQEWEREQKQVQEPQQKLSAPIIKGILLPRWLGHLIACFMPKKKNRQRFRAKYVKEKK